MERAGEGPRKAEPSQDRNTRVVPAEPAIVIALMVESSLAALFFCDREQLRFRACDSERFAQSRHAIRGPTINRVEPRHDMNDAEPTDQGLSQPFAGLTDSDQPQPDEPSARRCTANPPLGSV